jgi:ferric-dicitrate binding protein FerR (iron transport regulator)
MTEERLSYLFLKYLENTCSRQEMEEFFAYIRKAKTDDELRNLIKKVYEEIKLSHPSLTYVDEDGKLVFIEPAGETNITSLKKTAKNKYIRAFALATSIILVAGIIWVGTPAKRNKITTVETLTKKFTERKEQKYLLLPDSTQVWLNAASSLQFPDEFKPGKREVYLTGEAFFDVKHADKIPFLIHTRNVTTTVLGTAFNIKAYAGQKEITVSVSRGKVKVSRDDKIIAMLTKGKSVKINNTTEEFTEKDVSVENIAEWQQGNLVYDETPLEDIVKDLQNVFNTEIRIEDTIVGRLNVTTSFSRDIGAEKAVNILGRLVNKKIVNQKGTLIIK